MQVREAMTEIVLTIGPDHTLREAARRMRTRRVGAAVVIDDELPPCLITERDVMNSVGNNESADEERVGQHLSTHTVYASPTWSIEKAAIEMVRGGFRHILVLDGSEVAGILSMRDIVRVWTSDGGSCELPTAETDG